MPENLALSLTKHPLARVEVRMGAPLHLPGSWVSGTEWNKLPKLADCRHEIGASSEETCVQLLS